LRSLNLGEEREARSKCYHTKQTCDVYIGQ
jgi:hypothetical protein